MGIAFCALLPLRVGLVHELRRCLSLFKGSQVYSVACNSSDMTKTNKYCLVLVQRGGRCKRPGEWIFFAVFGQQEREAGECFPSPG